MSYEKISGTVKSIRYYYLFDEISAKVEKISSYKAQSTLKPDGKPDYDRIQLSVDELDLLKDHMEEAMLEIFDMFFQLITSNSIVHNTGIVIPTSLTITAGSFVPGNGYTIKTAGTTDWTAVGASSAVVGTSFIATAVGTGTGTADESPFGSYCEIKDNEKYRTINLDIIDKKITGAIVDYILYKWYQLKGLDKDAAMHIGEYQNALTQISDRTISLRQY